MDYCMKTLKNIEKMTRAFRCVSRIKKIMSIVLVGYIAFRAVSYFFDR